MNSKSKRVAPKFKYAVVQSLERGTAVVVSRHNTALAAREAIAKAERAMYRRDMSPYGSMSTDRFVRRVPASARVGSIIRLRSAKRRAKR